LVEKIEKVLKKIEFLSIWAGKLTSFLIIAITLLQVREVVARYVFDKPTIWNWELCTMLYAALFLMGGAWVMQERKHVSTDIIYVRLSPRTRAYLDIITYICFFTVFTGVMLWQGTEMAIDSIKIGETSYTQWGPPIYPSKTMMVVAFVLLAIQGIAKIVRDITFVTTGKEI